MKRALWIIWAKRVKSAERYPIIILYFNSKIEKIKILWDLKADQLMKGKFIKDKILRSEWLFKRKHIIDLIIIKYSIKVILYY